MTTIKQEESQQADNNTSNGNAKRPLKLTYYLGSVAHRFNDLPFVFSEDHTSNNSLSKSKGTSCT